MKLVGLFVMVLTITPSAEPQDSGVKDRVAALVKQLHADGFQQRRKAKRQLIELGPQALEYLPSSGDLSSARSMTDVNARVMVGQVRAALEERKVEAALKASQVNLQGKYPLAEVLAEIEKQTSNSVSAGVLDRSKVVAVSYASTPFWKAMLDIGRQLKADVRSKDGHVEFVKTTGQHASVDGVFLVTTTKAKSRKMVGGTGGLLRSNFELQTEPRLRALFMNASGRAIEATLSSKRPIGSFSPGSNIELLIGTSGTTTAWPHDFFSKQPLTDETTVDLNGALRIVIAAAKQGFRFANLEAAAGSRRSGVGIRLLLSDVEFDDERSLILKVIANWEGGEAFDSYRTWVFHNAAWLETPDGKRIPFQGTVGTEAQNGGAVRLSYRFSDLKRPLGDYRFVYEAPTLIRRMPVKFSLPNVGITASK